MNKITMLRGLPASGKSKWALAQVKASGGNKKRVCKDDLRAMLDDNCYSKGREKFILEIRDNLIVLALLRGHDVIIDDTNFEPKHEEAIQAIVNNIKTNEEIKIEFEIKDFKVPIKTCIKRDSKRTHPVGVDVIMDMAKRYLREDYLKEFCYVPDTTKPKTVIFDIDGTLADNSHRSPYDETKVLEDGYIEAVWKVLKMYKNAGYHIIFLSGRSEKCRKDTGEWLVKNEWINLFAIHLKMRSIEEKEKGVSDVKVKQRLFNEIKEDYCIEAVYDDRQRVVDMWREKDLRCFQVNKGDF